MLKKPSPMWLRWLTAFSFFLGEMGSCSNLLQDATIGSPRSSHVSSGTPSWLAVGKKRVSWWNGEERWSQRARIRVGKDFLPSSVFSLRASRARATHSRPVRREDAAYFTRQFCLRSLCTSTSVRGRRKSMYECALTICCIPFITFPPSTLRLALVHSAANDGISFGLDAVAGYRSTVHPSRIPQPPMPHSQSLKGLSLR